MPEPIDPGLSEVAAALAALRPSPPAIDRDRVLFDAGLASARRPWLWRATTAAFGTAAAALAAVVIFRPAPPPAEVVRVVYVHDQPAPAPPPKDEVPPAPPEVEPPAPPYPWRPATPYARLEDRLLRWGLDGLAGPTSPPAPPPDTIDSLLKSL